MNEGSLILGNPPKTVALRKNISSVRCVTEENIWLMDWCGKLTTKRPSLAQW